MGTKQQEIQMRQNALNLIELDKSRIMKEMQDIQRMPENVNGSYGWYARDEDENAILSILQRRLHNITRTYKCTDPIMQYYAVYGYNFTSVTNGDNILGTDEMVRLARLGYYVGAISDHALYISKL
jgi:hypothetical protein